MKVKAINRSEQAFTKERVEDVQKVHRNLDPTLHPFDKAKEYTRALNAAKLERVFAKPFLASLSHDEAVYSLAKNPKRLNCILAGCGDGIIKLWDVPERRCLRRLVGHTREVKGIAVAPDGEIAVSCSADCTAKVWKVPYAPFEHGSVQADASPVVEFVGQNAFLGVDYHWQDDRFATCGSAVDIWDCSHSDPIQTFTWGAESMLSIRFNPAEPEIFATTGSDRSVALYDLRHNTPIRKLVMQTRSNALAWNPMEPLNFVVANEDCNLYTYDMRKLDIASCVHEDFTNAVMDVDFSGTGREFVAGSYDRSIRIFKYNGGHSHEVYTTKRMQRVFATRYTGDATYIVSGSDDFNLRIWKAKAHEQLGQLLPREKHKQAYDEALKERYKHMPEVKRILRHRHLPATIYKAVKSRRIQKNAEKKKEKNRIAHSKPGTIKVKAARKKKVVAQLE